MHQCYLWKAQAALTPDGWKGTHWTVVEDDPEAKKVVRSQTVEGLEAAQALYDKWRAEANQSS